MKEQLDQLMRQRGLGSIILIGSPQTCANVYYIVGPVHLTGAYIVKNLDQPPVIVCGDMERDEAAATGLAVSTYTELGYLELAKKAESHLALSCSFLEKITKQFELRSPIAFYGCGSIPRYYTLLTEFKRTSGLDIVTEAFDDIFATARAVKSDAEIEHIRKIGELSCRVFAAVKEFISGRKVKDNLLLDSDGSPLTIGKVKQFIRLETYKLGASPEGALIFAQGRDAGVPHSQGDDTAPLVTGKTIVFDFCPRELGGGYFFDMTRTFCPGYCPDEVMTIYEAVRSCQLEILDKLTPGALASEFDIMANTFFEERGYTTRRSDSRTQSGYVHGLGHGVGLDIHEHPMLSIGSKSSELLVPGSVFTVEPGLYFPDREIGVRIEDVVAFDHNGKLINLTPFEKEPLIPLRS